MKTEIKNFLQNLRFGETQSHQHITVIPLHAASDGSPPYVALADAMAAKTLTVTEVSEGGSVPELLVSNDSDQPVLIIDGEELLGAKQNRILNTSILLKERSRTVVPVSCTEHGRWAYTSPEFAMSDSVLEHKIRSRKSRSVTSSLCLFSTPLSDQGEVWEGIHALHTKAKFSSPTSAMHDLVKAKAERLDKCLKAFPRSEGQVGLLVLLNGRVAGFDAVSRPEVYARLHERLVRSYVLDALLEEPPADKPTIEASKVALDFIASLATSQEEVFPSVGYGQDYRYHTPGLTGSALVHEGRVIHSTFLSMDATDAKSRESHISSLHRRRLSREGRG